NTEMKLAFLEGLLLSCYTFSKYRTKKKDEYLLREAVVFDDGISEAMLMELRNIVQAVFHARDLVNEPLSFLTAECFSEQIAKMGSEAGFSVEIFNKKKIEALRMGGLLAVNKGSIDPPTFTIMEWRPEKANNNKPVVLVGKGVVYDTGGLSLKP